MDHPAYVADDGAISPLSAKECREIVGKLGLPPQQARIVELILQDKSDKQIVAAIGLERSTVRTYMNRIFARLGVSDRVGVALCVFRACRQSNCPMLCNTKG